MGEAGKEALQIGFDRSIKLAFHGQSGAASTVRVGVQPGQLPASVGAACERTALDADHVAGQADQDRREGGASRTVCDIPTDRGGSAAEDLCGDIGADTTICCDLTEAHTDMTTVNPSSTQQNPEACAVALSQRPSKPPSRAFKPRSVARNRPNRLAPGRKGEVFTWFSWGVVILVPEWPGDGAGQGSFGK